jgi:N6-L-threonylcarbamoyladenine synthase
MLGLDLKPHGGAVLEALARKGDPARFPLSVPMVKYANCDFSFAGLKTGVRLCVERELPPEGHPGGWLGGGGVWEVLGGGD